MPSFFSSADLGLPASPAEIATELNNTPGWKEGPIPGVRILTVQSDGLFTGDSPGTTFPSAGAISAALPNQAQLSNEINSVTSGTASRNAVNSMGKNNTIVTPTKTTVDFRMSLNSSTNADDVVIFKVTPIIDESRQANYDRMSPVHHPGSLQVYKSTEARSFNVTAKLISRTSEEASTNLDALNLIRSWVMPYYGQGTAQSAKDKLGAPPDILIFDVYGDKNIHELPVVLTSYHWVYPDNVDYIPTNDGFPFPVIMEVTMALIESYSPEEYTGFDIIKYKQGDMAGAYTFSSNPGSMEESGT